jgi:hypothetical protein
MEQRKIIGNANVLDLRNATEASIAGISRVRNANVLLYTKETAPLLSRLDIGNTNVIIEVPSEVDVEAVTGHVHIKGDHFRKHKGKIYLVVVGQVIFEPDVPADDVERGLAGLVVVGQVICPQPLAGIVQAKTKHAVGQTLSYPPFEHVQIGSLVLDEIYLNSLKDSAELAAIGSVRVPEVVPNDLLLRKLSKLFVSGRIQCHAENATAIRERLVDGSVKLSIIPVGYKVVDKPLTLDRIVLESLQAKKLYSTEQVVIEADVDSSTLSRFLDELRSEELILCPATLRDTLSARCDLLENDVVFYEGELWLFEGDDTLRRSRFDHLSGKATVLVTGVLTIDAEVDGEVLTNRLAKVHNNGVIRCTPDQMGAIESILGIRSGELEDLTKEEGDWIANANYLEL